MPQTPSGNRFGPLGPVPVDPAQAERWVTKAAALAAPLIELAAAVGDPAPVEPKRTENPDEWAYGNFMLAWLDPAGPVRHVRHLPDASFFLRLLCRAYAPVLERRPELAGLLLDESRPEMSLTNDVLQIQLRSAPPGPEYSMIRNHALMLFMAALWLDEPERAQWLDLYDELVTLVDERPGGRPDLEALAACETAAFADFTELTPLSLDPAAADALLVDDDAALNRILDYQLYAAAAIGLLWRDYRSVAEADREGWYQRQLELYPRADYLNDKWMGIR